MNEKTEKQLNSIIKEQLKEIEKLENQDLEIKSKIKELKKDNKKLQSLFRKRESNQDDDIIPGQKIVEDVEWSI